MKKPNKKDKVVTKSKQSTAEYFSLSGLSDSKLKLFTTLTPQLETKKVVGSLIQLPVFFERKF